MWQVETRVALSSPAGFENALQRTGRSDDYFPLALEECHSRCHLHSIFSNAETPSKYRLKVREQPEGREGTEKKHSNNCNKITALKMFSNLKLWHVAEASCVGEFELWFFWARIHGSLWLRLFLRPISGAWSGAPRRKECVGKTCTGQRGGESCHLKRQHQARVLPADRENRGKAVNSIIAC